MSKKKTGNPNKHRKPKRRGQTESQVCSNMRERKQQWILDLRGSEISITPGRHFSGDKIQANQPGASLPASKEVKFNSSLRRADLLPTRLCRPQGFSMRRCSPAATSGRQVHGPVQVSVFASMLIRAFSIHVLENRQGDPERFPFLIP